LEGRESLKDDRLGCPCTVIYDNIEKEWDVIWKDQSLGVRAVAEEANLERERVRQILREELNVRKFCAKNGSKTAVRWTKRTSRGIVFGPFAMHWEWTRFVELNNYLWWSIRQATINAVEDNIVSNTKKSTRVIRSSRPCWFFFLSTELWWQSGYPAARW
jgi:hypothetical protein